MRDNVVKPLMPFLLSSVVLLGQNAVQAWLFALPQGSCESFLTCQDCVVEYALDQYNIRRPCTWCPASNSCEMMNQWTGTCATGQTYRDTCPILATELPQCVPFEYSFWICERARPENSDKCDQTFVDGFCSEHTSDKSLQICNGESVTLESVGTVGFGQQEALSIHKNAYGLEINLKYFWLNPGAGEDRRRIETGIDSPNDSFIFLCNARLRPDQAIAVKYRLSTTTSSASPPEFLYDASFAATTFVCAFILLSPSL